MCHVGSGYSSLELAVLVAACAEGRSARAVTVPKEVPDVWYYPDRSTALQVRPPHMRSLTGLQVKAAEIIVSSSMAADYTLRSCS